MVLAFCAACGLPPAEVVVVGDTPADLADGPQRRLRARHRRAHRRHAQGRLAPLADHVLASVQDLESVL